MNRPRTTSSAIIRRARTFCGTSYHSTSLEPLQALRKGYQIARFQPSINLQPQQNSSEHAYPQDANTCIWIFLADPKIHALEPGRVVGRTSKGWISDRFISWRDGLDNSSRWTSHHALFRLSAFFNLSIWQQVSGLTCNLGLFVIQQILNVNHTTPTEKFLSFWVLASKVKTYHIDSFKLEFSYCCLTICCKIMPKIVEFP